MNGAKNGMKSFLTELEELAGRQPDRIAMVDQDGCRQTSFRELEDLIDRVAAKLEGLGFPRGSFVLLCMGRRMEYVAAYIGIIKAGLAVVPATPDYPDERLAYIRENCRSPFTVTEDFFLHLPEGRPGGSCAPGPEDIVCMNYTSGSTGRPKGVCYSLRCVSESIRKAGTLFDGLDEIVTASSASLAFAAACAIFARRSASHCQASASAISTQRSVTQTRLLPSLRLLLLLQRSPFRGLALLSRLGTRVPQR